MILKGKTTEINLPVFFPDATHGAVKSMDNNTLNTTKTTGVVVNAYHLYVDNTAGLLEKHGGIHKYMNFNGIIISDSGGFQVMSLIRRNPKNGKITDEGVKFNVEGKGNILFTPEISIETQLKIGSDIVMCFDDCTEPHESITEQQLSVKRTVEWAKRCRYHFDKLTANKIDKPLLFGIIQGGNSPELRTYCGEELTSIGFDGYAFGGWPVDENKILLESILKITEGIMPAEKPKYAMGVGKPKDIIKCLKMGYNMFDCVLPTRDARHQRLYVYNSEPTKEYISTNNDFYSYLQIGSGKFIEDFSPISSFCDCDTCLKYSRSYINHLFKYEPNVAATLATTHNLRFYSKLMEVIA